MRKVAIEPVCVESQQEKQFAGNMFLVKKANGGNRLITSLKSLYQFIPYSHSKMECLQSINNILNKIIFMCKPEMKDVYFSIPLSDDANRYLRFYWQGNVYQFIFLCFSLSPAPYIFTKLLKVPLNFLLRLGTVIIYLDDMLILGKSVKARLNFRDTVTFFLQELAFVINQEKSVMIPKQVIEFSGMEIYLKTDYFIITTREGSEYQN